MKSITSQWFECTVQYEKTQENGKTRKVTERYVADALSFTEAETAIVKEMAVLISGEFKIRAIVPQPYNEIYFSDSDFDDRFFKVKVEFITLDEKTSKEKRSRTTYLVQAHTPDDAIDYIKTAFSNTALDFEVMSSSDTKVLDIFLHDAVKPEGERWPIEVLDVKEENLPLALGRALVHPVLKTCEETFKDADTGEEIKIERNEALYYRGDRVTPELWAELIQRKYKDVTLYRNV